MCFFSEKGTPGAFEKNENPWDGSSVASISRR